MKHTKKCRACKKIIIKSVNCSVSNWKIQKFCSRLCHYSMGRVIKKCGVCNKKFSSIKYADRIYCSQLCSSRSRPNRGGKIVNTCKICKQDFTPLRRGMQGRKQLTCSAECKRKLRSGEGHWNWRGGVSPDRDRNTKEYKEWRNSIYKRDRWTCQMCGVKCKSKTIVAHHIKSFKEFRSLRYVTGNGITLCRSCHKKVHKEIGYDTRFR